MSHSIVIYWLTTGRSLNLAFSSWNGIAHIPGLYQLQYEEMDSYIRGPDQDGFGEGLSNNNVSQ